MFDVRLLIAALMLASPAQAAPPEVKTLFPVGAQRGTTVEVTISGKLDNTARLWATADGITTAPTEKENVVSLTVAAEAPPGLHWLRFHNDEGAAALRPFVVGTLPEVVEQEPNDAPDAAQALESAGVVVNGTLAKNGEVDTFAVTLARGQNLVASLEANRALGSPMDGVLQVVSPRGFVLAQNDDDRGLDPQLVFTPDADGTYLVRTFAFPAEPNSSIQFSGGDSYIYRLTLTTGPFADHAVPAAATRGAPTAATVRGWNLPADLGPLPVTESDGAAVVQDPRLANTLTLPTVPHMVAVEETHSAEAPPQELALPVTVSGTIAEPGETDVYRFTGAKGASVALRCAARRLDSPLDPVLRVISPDGQELKEVDDSTRNVPDPELTLELPADGEYRVEVADLHLRGGFRFVYLLTAEPQIAGYSLSVAADSFKLEPGKPLEIPVTVARDKGFEETISVAITGLPEHVRAEAATSEGKGGSAKSVKLVLTSDNPVAWSGPIRITGTSDGLPGRTATAPVLSGKAATSDAWLTVLPAPAD